MGGNRSDKWIDTIFLTVVFPVALATLVLFLFRDKIPPFFQYGMLLKGYAAFVPVPLLAVVAGCALSVFFTSWRSVGFWSTFTIAVLALLLAMATRKFVIYVGDWDNRGAFGLFALAVAGVLLALIGARILHLLALAIRKLPDGYWWRGREWGSPHFLDNMLPSHEEVVRELKANSGTDKECPTPFRAAPNTLAVRARWGGGKTACLRRFQDEVEEDGTAAVVWFDCWRHQADSRPEFSLYREVAQTWAVLWPFGWMTVPALRFYLNYLPSISKAGLKFGAAEVEMSEKSAATLPKALLWQHHLTALVRSALITRRRVVVIMEDIDRCAVPAVQRYVTLIRRFLAVPGVTIVIPYVERQMRLKAFDPLNPQLADLRATTDAVLMETFCDEKLLKDWAKEIETCGGGKEGEADGAELIGDNLMLSLRRRLIREMVQSDAHRSQRVFGMLEEKYLSDRIIIIPEMKAADCAHIMLELAKERAEWREVLRVGGVPDGTGPGSVFYHVKTQLESRVFGQERPPHLLARQFEGAASQLLAEIDQAALEGLIGLAQTVFAILEKRSAAIELLGCFAHMAIDMAAARGQLKKEASDA